MKAFDGLKLPIFDRTFKKQQVSMADDFKVPDGMQYLKTPSCSAALKITDISDSRSYLNELSDSWGLNIDNMIGSGLALASGGFSMGTLAQVAGNVSPTQLVTGRIP